MNLEEINEIIANYDKLNSLTESKIKIMERLDSKYHTAKGIEEISFSMDEGDVWVECDNSCRGSYDSSSFSFPIAWLAKTDAELAELIVKEKELNEEKVRKIKEEKELKEKKETEERELKQYQKLKAKFETLN